MSHSADSHTTRIGFIDPYRITDSHTTANGFNIKTQGTNFGTGIGSSPYDVGTTLSFMDNEQTEDYYLNNIDDDNPNKKNIVDAIMSNRRAIKQKEREIEALKESSLKIIQTGLIPEPIEKKSKIKLKLGKNE